MNMYDLKLFYFQTLDQTRQSRLTGTKIKTPARVFHVIQLSRQKKTVARSSSFPYLFPIKRDVKTNEEQTRRLNHASEKSNAEGKVTDETTFEDFIKNENLQ